MFLITFFSFNVLYNTNEMKLRMNLYSKKPGRVLQYKPFINELKISHFQRHKCHIQKEKIWANRPMKNPKK